MNPAVSPPVPKSKMRPQPISHRSDAKFVSEDRTVSGNAVPALKDCEWDKLLSRYSLTLAKPNYTGLPAPTSPQNQSPHSPHSMGTLTRTLSEPLYATKEFEGVGCEIVQSRGEARSPVDISPFAEADSVIQRRRAQNRRAQRAYRARKEAQLKTASCTLVERQAQLSGLNYRNEALLHTIMQLKSIIVSLEAENQLLKEFQTPDADIGEEPIAWSMDNASLMSNLPEQTTWDPPN